MSNFFGKKSSGQRLGIEPDPAFKEKTKARFLAAFDAQHGTRPAVSRFALFSKIAIGTLAGVAIVAGASVYADSNNVSADSSLYSFKRLGEKVQLVFTSDDEKPQLQASFAVRRMEEISDISTRKPSSTIIVNLDSDMNTAIDTSINEQVKVQKVRSDDFCGKFFSMIGSVQSPAHDGLMKHPNVVQRLEERCMAGGEKMGSSTTE